MDPTLIEKILFLYPEYSKIQGPYLRKDGRKIVILYKSKKQRTTRQYAKVVLEVKIGRRLLSGEEVDHIDEDHTNDDPNNLGILSKRQNIQKALKNKHGLPFLTECPNCGIQVRRPKSRVTRRNFCSNSCRSLFYGANQYGNQLTGYN